MTPKKLFIAFLMTMSFTALHAQSLWTSAEMKLKIISGLNGFIEGEYRSLDELSGTERWAGTIGLDYKPLSFLKLTAGYTYIHQYVEQEITKKGNIISSYWQPKHRTFIAVTGSYKWNRFTFSLRERYQHTYRTEEHVPKFDSDGVTRKKDEFVGARVKHILRSRFEVEYDIKKCKFKPYASYELYNSIEDGFAKDKSRYSIGTGYKFNKKHSVNIYYMYIDHSDEDEASGNVIGIGYKFNL